MRHRLHAHRSLVALALLLSLAGCGKRYVPGTTPQQAMAYELNEGVTFLRSAQSKVIAAVDANPGLKPLADKFLDPVRDALLLTKDRLIPLLEAYDAAVRLKDDVQRLKLSSEIKPVLQEFNTLVATAFGAQAALPQDLVSAIAGFVAQVNSTITTLRTEFKLGGTNAGE